MTCRTTLSISSAASRHAMRVIGHQCLLRMALRATRARAVRASCPIVASRRSCVAQAAPDILEHAMQDRAAIDRLDAETHSRHAVAPQAQFRLRTERTTRLQLEGPSPASRSLRWQCGARSSRSDSSAGPSRTADGAAISLRHCSGMVHRLQRSSRHQRTARSSMSPSRSGQLSTTAAALAVQRCTAPGLLQTARRRCFRHARSALQLQRNQRIRIDGGGHRSASRPATHSASNCMPALVAASMTVIAPVASPARRACRSAGPGVDERAAQTHAARDHIQCAELGQRI